MRIEMKPIVHSWEIEKEFGIDVLRCQFTQMVENDSYVPLWLDEDRVDELREDIKYYTDKGEGEAAYVKRLENELDLINRFRAMGYTYSILVFVSW
jgi:hypothetical protein